MKIAPGIEDSDWMSLDLSRPESPDWDRAISILEQRLAVAVVWHRRPHGRPS